MKKKFTKTEVFYCDHVRQLKEANYFIVACTGGEFCNECKHSHQIDNIDEYKKQIIKDYDKLKF